MQQFNKHAMTAAILCCTHVAFAQTGATDTLINKQQALQPIEVRSLRAGSNAPFVKTDISAKDLEKANLGQDLTYLLQFTPSAVVTSDAGAGVGYTGLRVRGTDGVRMNVTLNGIPVNDAESQGTFFVNFPDIASSTSSVQLQRGVGTSTNGAGAFGATMSISTLQQYEKAGGEISNSYGSFNTWKHTVKGGTGLLKNGLQFDVRLSKISSDGYVDRSASDLKSMQILAGWKISNKTSLRFLLMTGKEKTGQAWNGISADSLRTNRTYNELGMKADGSFYNNQTDNYQQDYYQFFADHKFSKYLSAHAALFLTRGRGYYNEYRLGESFSTYGLPNYQPSDSVSISETDLTRQLWLDNHYYGGVFSLLYEKKKTSLAFGGGWTQYLGQHYGYVTWAQYNIPADYRWYLLHSQKNDLNLYVKAQQTVGDKLILFGDLQYRNVSYIINGFRKNPTLSPTNNFNFFNPKVGLTYLIKNTSRNIQKAYASFAVANKEPNRDDFEASPVNQPKPERLYDVEAGYEISRRKWSAGANLYYMSYRDQLVFTGQINDVGAYSRTNVPESYRAGIELQAGYKPAAWINLNGNVTFSDNRIKRFTEYVDNADDPNYTQVALVHENTPIALSPSLIAGGMATFSPFNSRGLETLQLDVLGKHVGKQYLDNSGDENRTISDYTLCDLRLRYSFTLKPFREIAATFAVNNVFDRKYESNGYVYYVYQTSGQNVVDNRYFAQAGINYMLGLTVKW